MGYILLMSVVSQTLGNGTNERTKKHYRLLNYYFLQSWNALGILDYDGHIYIYSLDYFHCTCSEWI